MKSALHTNLGTTTTYFVGAHYELTGTTVTKYYYAGSQRIAMRKDGTLYYLLGDHLGSTSLVTDDMGNEVSQTRYTYTGQYSHTADFGLMFYNARWYDHYLNHMTQPDTIVPDPYNSQDYDRYAYARNNPINYTDPSGHVTCEGANWDDGPQCVKKNPKAYDRSDPNNYKHFVHYRTVVICGWYTGGNCGTGNSVPNYNNEVPMYPYSADAYFYTDSDPNSGHTKEGVSNNVIDYIAQQQAEDDTLRFIIIGHSAGADAAILAANKLGPQAVSKVVLMDPALYATVGGQQVDLSTQANNVAKNIPTLLVDSNEYLSNEKVNGYVSIPNATYWQYYPDNRDVHMQMAVDQVLASQITTQFLTPLP